MNLTKVKELLEDNFSQDPPAGGVRNILFWYDEEGEFADDIAELSLDNAKILILGDSNAFFIKYLVEKEDRLSNYLLYSSRPKPPPEENWLLDTLKYSREFSTDKAFLIMQDLGVEDSTLRKVFRKQLKFFANKERYKKFASYHLDISTPEGIDIAVMSTLCKLPVADFEQVVKKVLFKGLDKDNGCLSAIENFADINAFWELLRKKYGYVYTEKSLEFLALLFLVTHFSYNFGDKLPLTWQKYVSSKKPDCIVFVSNFMTHTVYGKAFTSLADKVEGILNLPSYLDNWELDKYIECDTFRALDKEIIAYLLRNLLGGIGEYDKYRRVIRRRRTGYWFETYRNEYEALSFAIEIFALENRMGGIITEQSAHELLEQYIKKYYQMDYYYRQFYFYYDRVVNKEPLAKLAVRVENTYTNWYLNELAVKWSRAIKEEMLANYSLLGVRQQGDFYEYYVSPFIEGKERVFVIISDALRYEVAKELCDILNKEVRGATELEYMQGVVPSKTKYGMASLLPRKLLAVDSKARVIVDGINTSGLKNRERVLEYYSEGARAMAFDDMIDMKRADYQKAFRGRRLIYIYHNVIDAIGDKPQTERQVFAAVKKTLADLLLLVRNLVNHVSATNIFITADHGFIYRRSALKEVDKISKANVVALDADRRHILLEADPGGDDTLPISMQYLLGPETRFKAVVPKGIIRYKVQGGGANYAHGGVSLQEIVIPVIKFKHIRRDEYRPTKVEVKLTNISRKITNRITYLEFFQVDLAQDKKVPLRLKLYFIDEAGERISNENIIIADSKSKKPQDRTYREKFTLRDIAYDKSEKYYLLMEDEGEVVEKIYAKIPFNIDLLFSDDYGF